MFTGQIAGLLTGSSGLLGGGGGGLSNDIQYGFESSCPGGINQNTALLATAAAIGEIMDTIDNDTKFYITLLTAVGAGVIFRAVTQQQGRRRRKRSEETHESDDDQDKIVGWLHSLYSAAETKWL